MQKVKENGKGVVQRDDIEDTDHQSKKLVAHSSTDAKKGEKSKESTTVCWLPLLRSNKPSWPMLTTLS
eukprot:m.37295 g.37295  ORF g.37295 m.37295 type:complete len:68 (-) comp11094_c0_seq1:239-442(-)